MGSVWENYSKEDRVLYIKYLQAYGGLTGLFQQKENSSIPYLDSKFQETIYGRVFHSQNADIGNTPHDIVSVINANRVGIGLKTWMNSKPSYQKVMQLKAYKLDIDAVSGDAYDRAYKISEIKNSRLRQDYERLGLESGKNIYHYVTRDEGKFTIYETSYPEVDIQKIDNIRSSQKSIEWSDGLKEYKYTFGDSQVWMRFSSDKDDTVKLAEFPVNMADDPFTVLLRMYDALVPSIDNADSTVADTVVAYLPLYSYRSGEVEEKSGLNAWNGASKVKDGGRPRPLGEVYVPVPMEFHRHSPDFFCPNIFDNIRDKRPVEFDIILPNGVEMPGRLTGDNLKNFQSGSNDPTKRKPDGSRWGQSDLGNWLLVDVLGLHERELVTRDWLNKRGVDSIKLWHKIGDYSRIYLDFAEAGSFDRYMGMDASVIAAITGL